MAWRRRSVEVADDGAEEVGRSSWRRARVAAQAQTDVGARARLGDRAEVGRVDAARQRPAVDATSVGADVDVPAARARPAPTRREHDGEGAAMKAPTTCARARRFASRQPRRLPARHAVPVEEEGVREGDRPHARRDRLEIEAHVGWSWRVESGLRVRQIGQAVVRPRVGRHGLVQPGLDDQPGVAVASATAAPTAGASTVAVAFPRPKWSVARNELETSSVFASAPLTNTRTSVTGIQGAADTVTVSCRLVARRQRRQDVGALERARPSSIVTSRTGPFVPAMWPARTSASKRSTIERRAIVPAEDEVARVADALDGQRVRVAVGGARAQDSPATAARTRARGSAASRAARRPVMTSCTSQSMLRRCRAARRPQQDVGREAGARRRCGVRGSYLDACAGSPGRAPASRRTRDGSSGARPPPR